MRLKIVSIDHTVLLRISLKGKILAGQWHDSQDIFLFNLCGLMLLIEQKFSSPPWSQFWTCRENKWSSRLQARLIYEYCNPWISHLRHANKHGYGNRASVQLSPTREQVGERLVCCCPPNFQDGHIFCRIAIICISKLYNSEFQLDEELTRNNLDTLQAHSRPGSFSERTNSLPGYVSINV